MGTKETVEIEIAIIGGGILGLLSAYEINKKFPLHSIAVFEKSQYLGDSTTGRNSGVLHSGIYYDTDSNKHLYCLEGNKLWTNLSKELEIKLNRCGKFVLASNNDDELIKLINKAKKNRVKGIRELTKSEIKLLKNYCHFDNGFFSKTTGVIDIPHVIKSLSNKLHKSNIPVLSNTLITKVSKDDKYICETNNEIIRSKFLINTAGLDAINIRKQLGLIDLINYFVKGHYLKLNKKFYNEKLIYPLPEANLKGLGVHTSFSSDGIIRFGPDTLDTEKIDYKLDEDVIDKMYPAIQNVFKGIEKDDLSLDYAGIRPKLRETKDFHLKAHTGEFKGYIECCGIESPGLTAAPAIAKWVTKSVEKTSQILF